MPKKFKRDRITYKILDRTDRNRRKLIRERPELPRYPNKAAEMRDKIRRRDIRCHKIFERKVSRSFKRVAWECFTGHMNNLKSAEEKRESLKVRMAALRKMLHQ